MPNCVEHEWVTFARNPYLRSDIRGKLFLLYRVCRRCEMIVCRYCDGSMGRSMDLLNLSTAGRELRRRYVQYLAWTRT